MAKDSTKNTHVNNTVDKLAKICGMLGSSHDGERASAALLATQILSDLDLSWRDLVCAAFSKTPPPPEIRYDDRHPGWHVGYCQWLIINKADSLPQWEMEFLTSLGTRYAHLSLTEKQASVFTRIARKHGLEV